MLVELQSGKTVLHLQGRKRLMAMDGGTAERMMHWLFSASFCVISGSDRWTKPAA